MFIYFATNKKRMNNTYKKIAFACFVVLVSMTTLYLLMHTLFTNIISETKGPVHWHADFEIIICGEKQLLLESTGISNKVGTATLHHHNDYRIHVEGTLLSLQDASLGRFFESIGGVLTDTYIGIPQKNETTLYWHNGDHCPDGSTGTLSMYVQKGTSVTAVSDIDGYIISPEIYVPPGDKITIIFGER